MDLWTDTVHLDGEKKVPSCRMKGRGLKNILFSPLVQFQLCRNRIDVKKFEGKKNTKNFQAGE